MKKILIIEDQPMIRHLIKLTLEFENYAVTEAVNAQEGLKQATLVSPDLILLDIHLSNGKNGLDLCEDLKQISSLKNTKYIILTVSQSNAHLQRAQQLDIQHYLQKPFRPSHLIETVKVLIDERPSGI
mgnify:FL=1